MKKAKLFRWAAACIAIVMLVTMIASALSYDMNGDGKTNVWDLQLALTRGKTDAERADAVREALGGGDELHKNANGQWEIWSTTGLYNMAAKAEDMVLFGDNFLSADAANTYLDYIVQVWAGDITPEEYAAGLANDLDPK